MESTAIQWARHTHNQWIGCVEVSEGCNDCYARNSTPVRVLGIQWGIGKPRYLTSEENRKKPLNWNRIAGESGEQVRVFGNSLNDWLDNEVDPCWLADYLLLIYRCQNLTWMLLTKRPENWRARIEAALECLEAEKDDPEKGTEYHAGAIAMLKRWLQGVAPRHIWIGITTENQRWADARIPAVSQIPAQIRFLSVEPMYGPLSIQHHLKSGLIHWVILGGESKQKREESQPFIVDDARSLMQQCRESGVRIFFKQFGSNPVGLDYKLKDKKGGNAVEFPEEFQVREFPAQLVW